MHCVSLDSRPIKIRPGTYCRGDSAHALQITQNFFSFKIIACKVVYTGEWAFM